MRSYENLLILFLASILASCGKDADTPSDARDDEDAMLRDKDVGPEESGGRPTYSGVVLATMTTGAGTSVTYGASADFGAVGAFAFGECWSSSTQGSCCCDSGEGLPGNARYPGAGTVTLRSTGGTNTLATVRVGDDTLYALSDLGQTIPSTFYVPSSSPAWKPGDALVVSASGGEVHSFTGMLETGGLFAGVTPSIGSGSFVVDRAHDLDIAWTPDGTDDQTVILELSQPGNTCYCAVSDSTAKVTVSAALLATFGTDPEGSTIQLERITVSPARCDNATIDLVGEVALTAGVTFR